MTIRTYYRPQHPAPTSEAPHWCNLADAKAALAKEADRHGDIEPDGMAASFLSNGRRTWWVVAGHACIGWTLLEGAETPNGIAWHMLHRDSLLASRR